MIIEAEELSKSFYGNVRMKRHTALREVSFEVGEGEVYGFLGPNGAGKTTTIKILTSLVKPDTGHVRIFGKDPSDPDTKKRLGYLPENPSFYNHLKGRELLDFYARLFKIPSSARKKKIDGLLERTGIKPHADRPIGKYSKGMIQRLGIAQALINDPALLILDEPMSGLDPVGRREVRDLILEKKREGTTIFFSSHILADVEMICDKVAIISRGVLLKSVALGELLATPEQSMEIIVEGLGEIASSLLPEIISRQDGKVLAKITEKEKLPDIIRDIHEKGGTIISITPRRRTLEDIFMKEIGAAAPEKTE